MSGKLFDRYGAILNEDVDVLEVCLDEVIAYNYANARTSVSVLEIGMHDGNTAKGIEAYVKSKCGMDFFYTGIDVDNGQARPRYVPRNGRVIVGDSAEVFTQVADNSVDLVWVDGCHCINHVILDTIHYSQKVWRFGFMLFHDVNPMGQGMDHQYHGPDIPEFGLAIDAAHKAMRWPFEDWKLVAENWPKDVHNCGTRAYRRIA